MEAIPAPLDEEPVPEQMIERQSRREEATVAYDSVSSLSEYADENVSRTRPIPTGLRPLVRAYPPDRRLTLTRKHSASFGPFPAGEVPDMTTQPRLLRRVEVERFCQIGRSTIYRLMREGLFPVPIRVGPRAVRWPQNELTAWLAGRPGRPARAGGPPTPPATDRPGSFRVPGSPSHATHASSRRRRAPQGPAPTPPEGE